MNPRLCTAALAVLAGLALAACGPSTSSGEACQGRLPGDVVITEFLADPDGTDTGSEFIELYNATGEELDLAGLTFYTSDAAGGGEKKHTLRSVKVPAAGYLALGDARTDPRPSWLGYSYNSDLGSLRNTGGKIGVRCGTKVIDEVVYAQAAAAGHSRQLGGSIVPDSAVNDTESNWCDAPTAFDGKNFGTPGAPNAQCGGTTGGGTCVDPQTQQARPIVSPGPGELVISEFMADPSNVSDDQGEWVELFAPERAVDLNGLTVQAGSGKATLTSDTCLSMAPGTFAVLARGSDAATNGGLPFVTATSSSTLANSTGTLSIRNGEVVIDEVSWAKSESGASTQLDPAALDASANDDALNWCAASRTYGSGTDLGTPGEANSACPVVAPPGQCLDADTGFPRDLLRPAAGDLVISEWMPNPAAVGDSDGEWFELTALNPVDLNELTLTAGSGTADLTSGNCLHLEAGQQAVFARSTDPAVNGGLPFVTSRVSLTLANSGGSIAVKDGTTLLDQVTWTSSTSGAATQVSPTALDPVGNDEVANLCPATQSYGAGDKGSPGAPNPACGGPVASQCNDHGTMRDVLPPASGDLVITEVMADPSAVADTAGEWFEVMARKDVDLNGLQLGNEGSGTSIVSAGDCLHLGAQGYAVFARSADPALNGGLPAVAGTFSFGLGNSGTSAAPRAIVLRSGGVDVDRVSWTQSSPGNSMQLSSDKLDPVANDDPAAFCAADPAATYGSGDHGTPGAANAVCP